MEVDKTIIYLRDSCKIEHSSGSMPKNSVDRMVQIVNDRCLQNTRIKNALMLLGIWIYKTLHLETLTNG